MRMESAVKKRIFLGSALIFMLSACGPSEADMQATVTQVAFELFGTQTALAPTATLTFTPTITPTPTDTATPTATPTVTNTPRPPTATLTEAGVEKLVLCYRAAVSVYADWEAHHTIVGTSRSHSTKLESELNKFRRERRYRADGIDFIDKRPLPMGIDTLVVDGVEFEGLPYDRACEPYLGSIIAGDGNLSLNPWGVGASNRLSTARLNIRKTVRTMRKALLEVYSVDPAELEAIENPIWQHVHDRYDVELPD
jgi:hypothetical protein